MVTGRNFNQPPSNPWYTLLFALLAIAVVFIVFVYPLTQLYNTLVSFIVPLAIGVVSGGLMAICFTRRISTFILLAIFLGSMVNSCLFFINDVFADNKPVKLKLQIIEKQHSQSRSGPRVDIHYNNITKNINVEHEELLDNATFIVLTVNKGIFGYYIIRDEALVNE